MTITTVGYDVNPDVRMICLYSSPTYPVFFSQTFLGKVFGGLCAILGVFTLTLPIPIVVTRLLKANYIM